jgi:hypothetical protein
MRPRVNMDCAGEYRAPHRVKRNAKPYATHGVSWRCSFLKNGEKIADTMRPRIKLGRLHDEDNEWVGKSVDELNAKWDEVKTEEVLDRLNPPSLDSNRIEIVKARDRSARPAA